MLATNVGCQLQTHDRVSFKPEAQPDLPGYIKSAAEALKVDSEHTLDEAAFTEWFCTMFMDTAGERTSGSSAGDGHMESEVDNEDAGRAECGIVQELGQETDKGGNEESEKIGTHKAEETTSPQASLVDLEVGAKCDEGQQVKTEEDASTRQDGNELRGVPPHV